MGTRSQIVPRPNTGRQVGAGGESAAHERAQHQASMRSDFGLSDQRIVRPGPAASPVSSGSGIATLIILMLVALAVGAAAIWYSRALSSMSPGRGPVHMRRMHVVPVRSPVVADPALVTGETAPIDAAAEWEAAHPAPPEDDADNE